MEIIIRKIEITDAEILAELATQTFYDTFTGTCTEEDMREFLEHYFNVPQVKRELEDPGSFNFFAEIDNVPVAYIRFKQDDNGLEYTKKWKMIELKRLYVKKEFHGKGIAQKLMEVFMNYATENKYEAALLSVWEFNFKAQAFYSKYGFTDSGHGHGFPIGSTPQTDRWYWKFF